jgi:hypothetical protein
VVRYPEPRAVRRLRARRKKERADLERQAARAERRQAERRDASLTPDEVAVRMRELGITADRRRGDRRGHWT